MPKAFRRGVRKVVRKAPRQRTRKTKQSVSNTGYAGLVAHGVRTLLSVLPGSKLTTGIADFVFASLGYTKTLTINNGIVAADMLTTGLVAMFHLALKDIMFESYTHGLRADAATWQSNYSAGRLKTMTIKVKPESSSGSRRGNWCLAFIPFRNESDNKYYDGLKTGPLYEQAKLLPGSKSGPATSPLSITFTTSTRDGRLNGNLSMSQEIGAVIISFDHTNRTAYSMFSADEFSCMTTVAGVVALQRPNETPLPTVYARKLDDKMKNVSACVLTPDRLLQFSIGRDVEVFNLEDSHFEGSVHPDNVQKIEAYLTGCALMETYDN